MDESNQKQTTTDNQQVVWTINRAVCSVDENNYTFTYNGKEQSATSKYSLANVTIVSGDKGTNAGSYTLVVKPESDNYEWSDGTTGNREYSWTIDKYEVVFSQIDNIWYVNMCQSVNPIMIMTSEPYSGNEINFASLQTSFYSETNISFADLFVINSGESGTSSGSYTANITGIQSDYTNNYTLLNSVDIVWTINQATLPISITDIYLDGSMGQLNDNVYELNYNTSGFKISCKTSGNLTNDYTVNYYVKYGDEQANYISNINNFYPTLKDFVLYAYLSLDDNHEITNYEKSFRINPIELTNAQIGLSVVNGNNTIDYLNTVHYLDSIELVLMTGNLDDGRQIIIYSGDYGSWVIDRTYDEDTHAFNDTVADEVGDFTIEVRFVPSSPFYSSVYSTSTDIVIQVEKSDILYSDYIDGVQIDIDGIIYLSDVSVAELMNSNFDGSDEDYSVTWYTYDENGGDYLEINNIDSEQINCEVTYYLKINITNDECKKRWNESDYVEVGFVDINS